MARSMVKAALGVLALASGGAAKAEPVAPGPIVEAFNETCRRGFPSFETIRANALAQGWAETAVRMIVPPRGSRNFAPPLVLRKGDVSLFMLTPAPGVAAAQACQVAVSMDGRSGLEPPAIATFAASVSAALGAGDPEFSRDRQSERARWRVAGGYIVEAVVQNRGPGRMASLIVRREP